MLGMKDRWEYEIKEMIAESDTGWDLVQQLDRLGEEGWELIRIERTDHSPVPRRGEYLYQFLCVFKRKRQWWKLFRAKRTYLEVIH